jgi:hypothetical protein
LMKSVDVFVCAGVIVSGVPTVNRVVISVEEGKKDENAPTSYELLLEGTDLGNCLW